MEFFKSGQVLLPWSDAHKKEMREIYQWRVAPGDSLSNFFQKSKSWLNTVYLFSSQTDCKIAEQHTRDSVLLFRTFPELL